MVGVQVRSRRRSHWISSLALLAVLLSVSLQWPGMRAAEAATPIYLEHFSEPGGLPPGWGGSGQVVSDTGYGPPGSLKVVDDSTTAYIGARSPRIAVLGERVYNVTLYSHTDDPGDGGKIRVTVEYFASTPSEPIGTRLSKRWLDLPPTTTWRYHQLNFTTPGAARSIRIALHPAEVGVEKTGRAWFDEVTVTQVATVVDPVIDSANRPVPVTSVVDDARQLTPTDFWSRMPDVTTDPALAQRSLWAQPLLRRHFFATNLGLPTSTYNYYSSLQALDRTVGVTAPTEIVDGEQSVPAEFRRVIADDIRYRPIVSPHPYATGTYTKVYYARRMHDHLERLDQSPSYLPSMTLSGNDPRFATRAQELLSFLLFSQYTDTGDNPFTRTYYPAEFEAARAAGLTTQWRGGWDFLYNWRWSDAYGYPWGLHEVDHHGTSQLAATMARAFEVTGNAAYLEATRRFVHHQFPRYGWHTGIWDGKRYYWTEYNPSGGSNPKLDATDNVQALAAHVAAMVGFYTGNRRMLEYARGLLWYCVRELTTDGRWYYDGGENPLNQRRAISHDTAVMLPLLAAVPYLLKAGVPLDEELTALTRAYEFYTGGAEFSPFHRIGNGQMAKVRPERDDATREWKVTSYFTANRAGTGLTVTDNLPVFSPPVPAPATFEVRVSKLVPPSGEDDDWTVDPAADKRFTVTEAQLKAGIATGLTLTAGDAFRISYRLPGGDGGSWVSTRAAQVSFTEGGTPVTVLALVSTPTFPTVVTDTTFASTAAKLAFPRTGGEVDVTVRA